MKKNVRTIISIALLLLTGCATLNDKSEVLTMENQAEDIGAIQKLANDFRTGWLTGDSDLLLSLYADEPILMPQDQPAIIGKEALRPMYQAILKELTFESNVTVEEIEVSGDLGYYRTSYTFKATPKSEGEAIEVTGKTLFIVKRQKDGSWKIFRLMDNSDGEMKNNQ